MLTVDFERLGLRPGDRVLDMGCGAGRHAFEVYRRGGDVIAFDQDADELAGVLDLFAAMRAAGEVPAGGEADVKQGDALQLPFADGEFDRVVAAEVLEHIPADIQAIGELARVLRPGGTMAVSVPRWFPEIVNWRLSREYHSNEGGHIRIYTDAELVDKVTRTGLEHVGTGYAHGLHSPYWWIKCAVGVRNDDHPLARAYHRLLVWEITSRPLVLRLAGRVLDPLIGKSLVLYFRKPGGRPVTSLAGVPYVAGVLSARQVAETAASIAATQEPSGAVPWTAGGPADIWNHVEAAMAMLAGGEVEAAERALSWVPTLQRADGSWPMKVLAGVAVDPRGEANNSAYLAVGLWHHWLVRRDAGFVRRLWPSVRAGLDWVVAQQTDFGGISWTPTDPICLLAGSSSIYQSLRAGVALADLVDDPQPEWELAGGRLGHAVREHRDRFADKSTHSMDWFYPVLGGPVRGPAAQDLLASRWHDFVVPGLGIRCVDTNPWVTGAETCELVMALDAIGDHRRALRLLADTQHLRAADGSYWTGWVFSDHTNVGELVDVTWPDERTTYTAAAVILATDALGEVAGHGTAASGIMRGTSFGPPFAELALECGCPSGSGDRVAGAAAGPA